MKDKIQGIKSLRAEYSALKDFSVPKINKDIFKYLRIFTNDKNLLAASLVQNPYGKTVGLKKIRKDFGDSVAANIKNLNRMHDLDGLLLRKIKEKKPAAVLFLLNSMFILDEERGNPGKQNAVPKEKMRYALKLLDGIDITEIKTNLEDKLFSRLSPEIYKNYKTLLGFTKKKYAVRQKEITRDFEKLLRQNDIEAEIQTRIKTIYSIHNKIIKRNLLFSQILDTIGLRVIVEREEDCYKAMVVILKKCPAMTSRVKDYIAIPKENGYQSLHLTVIYEGQPVEIQIRTEEMHRQAQYGRASHREYKSDPNQ